jgi:hypothetical protein
MYNKTDCVTKLCRRQAEIIQNHENEHVHGIGQGEASGDEAYDRSSD